ncbi:MAG: ABC transporter ATP-binding protein [Bacteroidota bacterium]
MIQISELNKSFNKLHVLKNISVDFVSGEVVSVIGPNGSGKTTMIKCLLGMVIPDSGKLYFNGNNILGDWNYRNDIGYMPQIGRYPDNMKIGQIFEMMKDIREKNEGLDEELIDAYNLKSMFDKPMRTLSGGTRQKVSAALAFLFQPKVLVLDEPTAGLDPIAAEILKEKILKEKNNGKLILITSHIMSEVDEIADKVLYIFEGKIRFYETVSSIKTITNEEKLGRAIAQLMNQTTNV